MTTSAEVLKVEVDEGVGKLALLKHLACAALIYRHEDCDVGCMLVVDCNTCLAGTKGQPVQVFLWFIVPRSGILILIPM